MLLLHILLLILKIIGILLLIVLGLIILVAAVVLLVPIRYRVFAAKYTKALAQVNITWLFHLIEIFFCFDTTKPDEERLRLKMRIAWLTLYDNQKKQSQKEKKPKDNQKKKAHKTMSDGEKLEQAPQKALPEPKVEQSEEAVVERKQMKEDASSAAEDQKIAEQTTRAIEPKPIEATSDDSEPLNQSRKTPFGMIKSIVFKIIGLIKKIMMLMKKIVMIPVNIHKKIRSLFKRIEALSEKKDRILAIYYDEYNHIWFVKFFKRLRRLLIRLLPRLDILYAHFGFDDPALTGQVLGFLSIFYGIHADKLKLEPEFNEFILEGKIKLHGHVRLWSLFIFAIKSFLNKRFFAILKQVRAL